MSALSRSVVTIFDPMGCSPLGSYVQRISQARILGWVAISSSRGSFDPEIKSESLVSPALAE